ncbi:MurR/RpiR family transcriptional regulator [Pseudaminobacter soli (ex Li et al. 2025)]|uniref:MurR/RpiR family transcriptional regulator n=1 Tax=Pseudaminobacter soli (ex Li et al. 2025) TaxID=1295366 RepID=A0A2P7S8Y9_9HYPH|nr:MurR/RpiR family transcriptional regulator [Mesorhizobium soli]
MPLKVLSESSRETFGAPSLPRMRKEIDGMPEALSRIGKYILDNPERVVRSSLAELAVLAQSGEASVVRFCKHLGYAGYRDLKIALTAELASQRTSRLKRVSNVGGLTPLADRLGNAINGTAQNLDPELLLRLAIQLKNSRRIDIFGAGISGIVAEMVAYRLMRVGLIAQAFQDATLAHEVITRFDSSCVAIGISEMGLTPDTVRFLSGARAAGAFTLAITGRANSPLTQNADAVLLAVAVDPPPIAGEMTAVPAKILLVEALAGAIAAE